MSHEKEWMYFIFLTDINMMCVCLFLCVYACVGGGGVEAKSYMFQAQHNLLLVK